MHQSDFTKTYYTVQPNQKLPNLKRNLMSNLQKQKSSLKMEKQNYKKPINRLSTRVSTILTRNGRLT